MALTTQHIIGRTPVEGSFVGACIGELITFVGVFSGSLNIVSEPGKDNHVSDNLVFKGTGTGQTTGAKYVILDNFHHSFYTPTGPAPNGTITDHDVARLVSQGSLEDEFLHFDIPFVFTGQGEVKITVDNFTSEYGASINRGHGKRVSPSRTREARNTGSL